MKIVLHNNCHFLMFHPNTYIVYTGTSSYELVADHDDIIN